MADPDKKLNDILKKTVDNTKNIASSTFGGIKQGWRSTDNISASQAITAPTRAFFKVFWKFVKIFLFIVGIALLVLLIIFLTRASQAGTLPTYSKNIVYAVGDFDKAWNTGGSAAWNFIWNGGSQQAIEGSGGFDVEKDTGEHLIEIKNIENRFNTFPSKSPIDINVQISVENLTEDSEINLTCILTDYKGEVKYTYPIQEGEDKFIVRKGIKRDFTILVSFVNGLELKGDQQIQAINGRCYLRYSSGAKSKWSPYILESKQYDVYLDNKEDPLKTVRSDPNLKGEYTSTVPFYLSSIMLQFDVFASMPYVEGLPYPIDIVLQDYKSFSGQLYKLNTLKLYLPPEVRLADAASDCDLMASSDREDSTYSIYEIRKYRLDAINIDCDDRETLRRISSLSRQQCIDNKKNAKVRCLFYFTPEQNNKIPQPVSIWTEANYIYELDKPFLVNVAKITDVTTDVDCSQYKSSEVECNKAVSCMPQYTSGKMSDCVKCSDVNKCEDYNSKYTGTTLELVCRTNPCEGVNNNCYFDASNKICREASV